MKRNNKQILLWCVLVLTMASIIPLLMLSFYNHPSADDFAYAVETHMVWKSTRNMFLVLRQAVATSVKYWNRWQGLYTSAFLLALEPGIFGEQYYRITGFLTVGTIVVCNLIFSFYILHKRLGIEKLTSLTLGMLASFLMIHWMPSTVEGLYWYNGAVNYTVFFGLLLLLICVGIDLCKEQSTGAVIGKTVLGILLAVLLSGGNHITAFAGLLVVAGICVVCFWNQKLQYVVRVLLVLAFELAGFLVNILSPGTRVRSDAFEKSRGVLWTAWNALQYLLERMNSWIGLALIVSIVVMLPAIFSCVEKIRIEKGFHFPYPLPVFVASVGFLTAMCCPSYYAMGVIGAGRLVNVVYFAFILLVFINAFYVCGWLCEKLEFKESVGDVSHILTVLILCFGMIVGCYRDCAGYIAWKSVSSGEALAYSLEADARYNLYIQSAGQDVEVPAFSFYPQLLHYDDITEDPEDWRNLQVEEYYELNSVVRR